MSSKSVLPQPVDVPNPPEYDLFVVHAEADRAWVDGYLKHALGLDPGRVMSPRDFRLGASVVGEFERGVTSSRFTLLVLTPAFLADRWAELAEGLVSFCAVDEGRNRLLALTLHPCQAPLRLRFRESLDCTEWTHWDDEAARLRRHLNAPEPTIEAVPCPYPGMVPFRKEDARFFHGRDDEIRRLLTLIRQHHFLAVIGSSGSGKSSLVTAGLMPRLDDPRNFPRGTWRVLTLRPGATPVDELARTLGAGLDDPAGVISSTLAADLPAQKLLLIIDQFEELFSQVKDASVRDAFIGHLKVLRADSRCTVILTIRADFYGDLMNSALWPIDKSQLIEVAALRGESLRQAIVKPAEAVGVYLEEGLIERLLTDAADEPGSLPMLQEALVLLWGTMSGRLLTRASYDTLGLDGRSGLAVAMATKADATLAALPPDQQRIARRIFLRLVQFGEGRPDTRRQLGIDDLRAETDAVGVFDALLQQLITNRLLTPSPDEARGLRVDIAHEMLIVGWPASRDWVESRREAEKIRRRLVAKAEEWVRLGRGESGLLDPAELTEADAWLSGADAADLGIDADVRDLAGASHRAIESRKRRKQMWTRVAIGGLTTALIAISAIAFWGEIERRDAEAQRKEAVAQKKAADDSKIFAVEERNKAIIQKKAAELQTKMATSRQLAALSVAERNRRLDRSLLLSVEAVQAWNTFEARESLFNALHDRPGLTSILYVEEGPVTSVAFSPDGKTLAAVSADFRAGRPSSSRGVVLWDVDGRRRLAEKPLPVKEQFATSLLFSPDGKTLAAGCGRGVMLWDVDGRRQLTEDPLPVTEGDVHSVAFSPDGKTLAAGCSASFGVRGGVVLWDVAGRRRLAEKPLHLIEGSVMSVAFSPDGKTLAGGHDNGTGIGGGVVLWDVAGRKRLAEKPLPVNEGSVMSVAFSLDSKILAAGYSGGVVLWDAADWRRLAGQPLLVKEGPVMSVAFNPDGKTLGAVYEDGVVLWDAVGRSRLAEQSLRMAYDGMKSAAFSPDGKTLAAGYATDTINSGYEGLVGVVLWDMAGRSGLAEQPLHVKHDVVTSVDFSPDSKFLAAGYQNFSGDGGVVLWSIAGRSRLAEESLPMKEGAVSSVAFSPDSKILAAGYSGGVVLWDAAGRRRLAEQPLRVKEGHVTSVAFCNGGHAVVAGYQGGGGAGVVLWDTASQRRMTEQSLPVNEGHVTKVVLSPDGKNVAAVYDGGAGGVVMWDALGRSVLTEKLLRANSLGLTTVAFSADSKTIAEVYNHIGVAVLRGVDKAGGVVLRDVAGRSRLAEELLVMKEGVVSSVAFSPDGTTLAAGYTVFSGFYAGLPSSTGGVVLWDAAGRKRLVEEPLHVNEGAVTTLAFSPDGTTLAAGYLGNYDNGVVLWDVDLKSWQHRAGKIANRYFTRDEWRHYFPEESYRPTFLDLPLEREQSPKPSVEPTVGPR